MWYQVVHLICVELETRHAVQPKYNDMLVEDVWLAGKKKMD